MYYFTGSGSRWLYKQGFRLCVRSAPHQNQQILKSYSAILVDKYTGNNTVNQRRYFSFQNTIDSVAKTQTGFFKVLSESTPVEFAQKFLLTLHDTSGLPWWATIVCTTILLRTCITVPLAVYQYYILAKLENLKLEMPTLVKELQQETAVAIKMYKWDERKTKMVYNRSVRKIWNNLIVRDNCHPLKASLLLLFQIPMWICLSVSLRNLVYMLPDQSIDAKLTFAELSIGGFGFIPNLTMVDASWIFPFTLGIVNLAIIEMQALSKVTTPTRLQSILTNIFRGVSVVMIPIAASVPSCLVLYWTTSSIFGLVQNMALMSPKLKRVCRIPETASELKHPYQHLTSKIRSKYSFITGISKPS